MLPQVQGRPFPLDSSFFPEELPFTHAPPFGGNNEHQNGPFRRIVPTKIPGTPCTQMQTAPFLPFCSLSFATTQLFDQCYCCFSGAQDFLPDFLEAPKWYSIYGIYPKYTGLVTAMSKAKAWMMHARVSHFLATETDQYSRCDCAHKRIKFCSTQSRRRRPSVKYS